MFKKVLVANRGEIAVRIIRTLNEMGIMSVAVYSEADKESRHVEMATEAICIGPPEATKSYLSMPAIISAAEITRSDAIHPGYGFLSENPLFVEACAEHDIIFIGPSTESVKLMGNKSEAKKVMKEAGLPVVPGMEFDIGYDIREVPVDKLEKEVGFPLMIKASFGGGGRGIRLVRDHRTLLNLFEGAQAEAGSAFGSDHLYVEKFLERARHVELQVLADTYGNVAVLGERDCSIQRRHQKLIEETPCSVLTEEKRLEMFQKAKTAMKEINYFNAGTIEFLLDDEGNYYFIEMNTRLQVEHPVTEMVTGIDIVKEQILISAGEKLSFEPEEVKMQGAAIEFRINAEDPENNFMPVPGKITHLRLPGGFGVRVDTHIYEGYSIPRFYDSLVAKIIVWGKDRGEAIQRSKRALRELQIHGIKTTKDFHLEMIDSEAFKKGEVYTYLIDEMISS